MDIYEPSVTGTIKKRNRKKYLKIWDNQIKQLIETKKTSYKND